MITDQTVQPLPGQPMYTPAPIQTYPVQEGPPAYQNQGLTEEDEISGRAVGGMPAVHQPNTQTNQDHQGAQPNKNLMD